MIFRLTGAAVRAVCVAILVMLPAILLPQITQSVVEYTRIVATIMAIFVLYEYGFSTPTIIEFRFAAPYNRIKYLLLFALVVTPSLMVSAALNGQEFNGTLSVIATNGYALMDFPFSPVMIVADTFSENDAALGAVLARAIALNLVLVFACTVAFCGAVFSNLWQFGGDGFNMWLNMPTYKSYEKNSLQERLGNSAYASVLIACLIPLFGPTMADVAMALFTFDGKMTPIVMVWSIAIWTFLPAMFLMRAVALVKISMNRTAALNVHAYEVAEAT